MKQLTASELALHKIFSSDYDFRIPDYQRPYAWGTEETVQLLDDLRSALEGVGDEPYFLGSVVLVKDPSEPTAMIIDGQQRITTLTILLAVLRDLAASVDIRQSLEARIREPGDPVMKLEAKPRLTLRNRDEEFFRENIQESGSTGQLLALPIDAMKTDAQKNIRDNARELLNALTQWSVGDRDKLASLLMARTYLVVVSTPDLESAYRIFSVMNSRGLDLSPTDIFKAEVLGVLDADVSAVYAEKWEDAEEEVGREQFVDMFLHIRLIHSRERAKLSLLKEFPVQVLADFLPDRSEKFIDEVVVPYAQAFSQIATFTYASVADSQQVNNWFKRLSQLDTNDWQAAALWALRYHGDQPLWLDGFFRRLERLAASMYFRRINVTDRVVRYIELLRELNDGDGLDSASFELTLEEKAKTLETLDGDVYLSSKTRKYALLRLDEILANNPGVTYDMKVITVEHVLPQHPKVDSRWMHDFTETQRESWTHRIGNLVLLNRSKNSEAQNFEFDEKKQKYFQSDIGVPTFALTTQVLALDEWTPEILATRQVQLMGRLAAEWQLA